MLIEISLNSSYSIHIQCIYLIFRCQYANYCSEKCLEEDRPIHDAECYYFARRRTGGPGGDTCRMVLRIILTMRSLGAKGICDIVPGRKGNRRNEYCSVFAILY